MYACGKCRADPRVVSRDGTHRQCVRVLGEVTAEECGRIRAKYPEEEEPNGKGHA